MTPSIMIVSFLFLGISMFVSLVLKSKFKKYSKVPLRSGLTGREIAEKILQFTGSSSKIIHLPLPEDDPLRRQPDIQLAGKLLHNWYPKVKLDEGLMLTIEYFRKKLKL